MQACISAFRPELAAYQGKCFRRHTAHDDMLPEPRRRCSPSLQKACLQLSYVHIIRRGTYALPYFRLIEVDFAVNIIMLRTHDDGHSHVYHTRDKTAFGIFTFCAGDGQDARCASHDGWAAQQAPPPLRRLRARVMRAARAYMMPTHYISKQLDCLCRARPYWLHAYFRHKFLTSYCF